MSRRPRRYELFEGAVFPENPALTTDATKLDNPAKKKDVDAFPTTHLLYGYAPPSTKYSGRAAGWGYRHIAWNHGWTERDRTDTAEALLYPAAREEVGGTRVHFGVPYKQNGIKCVRKVVVATRAVPARGSRPADPIAKGIITSLGITEAEALDAAR